VWARQAGAPPVGAAPVVEAVPLAEARLEAAVETAFDALHERVAHEAAVDRPIPHEEPGELPAPDEVSAALADVEKEFFREGGAVAAAPAPASAVAAPRAAAVKPPAAPQAKPAWGRWLAAAAVFAALVGAVYLGLQIKPPAKPLPPPPKPIGDANIFNLEGVTITPEPGGPSFADMVAALAAQADEYFKTNRITDPPDDSAFGIYSFILDIDPKNQAALEGIKRIENHYLTLGRGLLKTKKYDKAEWSFKKVLSVNGNNEDAKRGLADAEKALKKEGRPPEPGGPGEKPEPPTPPEKGQPIAPTGPGETGEPLKKVTANDIQATISKYMGRVKFCFAKNPEAKGVAKVRFVVNPDGSVSDVSMAESTIGNADIEQCLVRRVAVMRFPAFEGAAKTVTFPFRFNE
jgi:TonB family protein